MVQIVNVSQARSNLSKLLKKVNQTKKPVIILQDSTPSAVIYPYDQVEKQEQLKEKLFELEFERMLEEGKRTFKKYLKKKNIPFPKTEEEAYEIIKNA